MEKYNYQYIASLVQDAKTGNSDAFAELYAISYNKQYLYAYHYLKDEYMAQDALREVYILAFRNINSIKDNRLFISWVNQINFHVCRNMQKQLLRSSSELDEMDIDLCFELCSQKKPETYAMLKNHGKELSKTLHGLSAAQQQILTMRYLNKMKLKDIAVAMDLTLNTVKHQLNNSRIIMKAAIKSVQETSKNTGSPDSRSI